VGSFDLGTFSGYFLGAGVESKLGGGWSLRGEYRFSQFDSETVLNVPGIFSIDFEPSMHTARLALTYKFGRRDEASLRPGAGAALDMATRGRVLAACPAQASADVPPTAPARGAPADERTVWGSTVHQTDANTSRPSQRLSASATKRGKQAPGARRCRSHGRWRPARSARAGSRAHR
jgi:hypothetical protein